MSESPGPAGTGLPSAHRGGPVFPGQPPVPSPGDPAPDFSLPWKPGEPSFRLYDYLERGPVVLLFFPMAFSPVCTEELCSVAGEWSAWNELEATVVAISVDSLFVTARFAEACDVAFPILSDFNREACTAYGVREDDYFGSRGVAKRAAFVVDQAGKVAYAWVTDDDSVLPDFDEVRRAAEAGRQDF